MTSEATANGSQEDLAEEQEALARMKGMDIQAVLQAGHEATIRLLTARAIAGTASHQELAILRNILRDNGMVLAGKVIDGSTIKPLPLPDDIDIPALPAPDYLTNK
ncbi:MAG: hypothetical protein ACREP9_19650 [Candidatus Dormibacteraceae bacterium]